MPATCRVSKRSDTVSPGCCCSCRVRMGGQVLSLAGFAGVTEQSYESPYVSIAAGFKVLH